MKFFIQKLLSGSIRLDMALIFLCLLCFSCAEDRSHEYYEMTGQNRWIYDSMKDYYLWADDIQEPGSKEFFGNGEAFMSKLTQGTRRSDNWSYCIVDSAVTDKFERGNFNHFDAYGLDFVTMTDPTGVTSRQMGRITYVYGGSPADTCGLQRNDFITMIDGERLGTNSVAKLKKGTARKLEICHLTADSVAFVWADTMEITLSASTYVEDVPFPICNVRNYEGVRVGYLMVNRLTNGPEERDENSNAYVALLQNTMTALKSQHPDEIVLDLRYCNSGTIEQAIRLASCLVPESYYGMVFAKTVFNSKHTNLNTTYTFDASMSAYNLGLSRLHIIVGSYTRGASEWLVQALRNVMPAQSVWVTGTKTQGQNVITSCVASDYGHRLYPAVCYVITADEQMMGGIVPDLELNELQYSELYEFGIPEEILLNTCIRKILGLLDAEAPQE